MLKFRWSKKNWWVRKLKSEYCIECMQFTCIVSCTVYLCKFTICVTLIGKIAKWTYLGGTPQNMPPWVIKRGMCFFLVKQVFQRSQYMQPKSWGSSKHCHSKTLNPDIDRISNLQFLSKKKLTLELLLGWYVVCW